MIRWNVVLAGGIGSRFWPLSTPARPKQLLPLVTNAPMLKDSLDRLRRSAPAERTLVLTNAELREAILALDPSLPPENVIAEPKPAGTCAALAWASSLIAQRDGREAVMVCTHADSAIGNVTLFQDTLNKAAAAATESHSLMLVGIVPSRPDVGFGYIEPGSAVEKMEGVYHVSRFVEKPNQDQAIEMVKKGLLWNSGIFAWRVGDLLDELNTHTPEVAPALAAANGNANMFFNSVTPIAIDVGVLERSKRVLVIPGNFGWDDVGTWSALHRVRALDQNANAISGPTFSLASSGNVVHAEDTQVILYGVQDLVVVARNGLVMVTTREYAANLKTLLDALPEEIRNQ